MDFAGAVRTGRSEEKAKGDAAKQWSKQSQDKPKDLLSHPMGVEAPNKSGVFWVKKGQCEKSNTG